MQVSLEKSRGLERRLRIEIPSEEVAQKEQKKLNELSKTVKMDGFRKGKIPVSVIKERYAAHVRQDVISDLVQDTIIKAIIDEKLNPAGRPRVEEMKYEEGKPFSYLAIVEVYPEIKLKPFDKLKIAKPVTELTNSDVDTTIEKLRQQQKTWEIAPEGIKVTDGMQVEIDFTGTIKGEAFEGGSSQNFKLEIGSGRMIPGFEEEIIGMKVKAGEERKIDVKFPKDYHKEDLAGKKAQFLIKLHQAHIAKVPELDAALLTKLGGKEGETLAEFKVEVRKNMQRELARALKKRLKKAVLESLYEANKIEVPQVLIEEEVEHEKKRLSEMFGQQNEALVNAWLEKFKPEAEKRVAYGLLLGEVIKTNSIKVDDEQVRQEIAITAESYENPQEVIDYYLQNRQYLKEVEALVLEDQVIDKIIESAKVSEEKLSFQELMGQEKDR